jgi:type II secretion system (T2SS) protein G
VFAGRSGTPWQLERTDRLTPLPPLHTIKTSMRGTRWLPITLVLGLLTGCGASRKLSEDTARSKILELGLLELKDKQIQVQRIIHSGEDQAVAEVSLQLAFRLAKTKGKDWQVNAVRLGDRDWIGAQAFLAALNEVRARQTQQSLEQLQEGIRKYQAKRGALPAVSDIVKLTDLLFPEYMAEIVRYDAWSHEFKIKSAGDNALLLSSAGPDGVPGNADDIRLEVRPI